MWYRVGDSDDSPGWKWVQSDQNCGQDENAPLLILTYSFHIKAMEVNPPTTSNGPQESCEVLASCGFSDC